MTDQIRAWFGDVISQWEVNIFRDVMQLWEHGKRDHIQLCQPFKCITSRMNSEANKINKYTEISMVNNSVGFNCSRPPFAARLRIITIDIYLQWSVRHRNRMAYRPRCPIVLSSRACQTPRFPLAYGHRCLVLWLSCSPATTRHETTTSTWYANLGGLLGIFHTYC